MIAVLGGAGYIGSHFCRLLAEKHERFVVFDSFEHGHIKAIKGYRWHQGDLRNAADLEAFFVRYKPDIVLHFAAYISVGESVANPQRYFDNNVGGTANVVAAMRRHGVHRMVFSSTAAVYGEPETTTLSEDHPLRPVSPYGQSKQEAELLIQSEVPNWVIFRYFNAAGADASGKIGEDHRPETHLIPLAVRSALGQGPPITVFGTDYPTSDGTAVRDYIHVTDLAEAHYHAVKELRGDHGSVVLNLGSGRGHTVMEVLQTVERTVGKPVPMVVGPRRDGDAVSLIANPNRIGDLWGWAPRYSNMDRMVTDAVRWHQSHPHGYGKK